jgi:hypothetical protein
MGQKHSVWVPDASTAFSVPCSGSSNDCLIQLMVTSDNTLILDFKISQQLTL